jgi:hypothetical protein
LGSLGFTRQLTGSAQRVPLAGDDPLNGRLKVAVAQARHELFQQQIAQARRKLVVQAFALAPLAFA